MEANVEAWLARYPSPVRREHALRVAAAAHTLAAGHGADAQAAYYAGILHDLARDYSTGRLLSEAQRWGINVDVWEKAEPLILHGPVAAAIIKVELGIDSEEILAAVRQHTLGAPNMSKLAKIVYLADAIEPARKFPQVERLRQEAERDLDRAVLLTLEGSIAYLIGKGAIIHPHTLAARNWLLLNNKYEEGEI